jgi:hypothetical protein
LTVALEHFLCSEEIGVQGRMGANIAHVMSAICAVSGVNLAFRDLKATTDQPMQGKVPEVAIITRAGRSRALVS